MNYIVMSPHFPDNFQNFTLRLAEKGIRVLGIASEPYDALPESLKQAMTEYYRVEDMENYDQMLKACGYFTHKYGKIDRIESQNEYWMMQDAALRTDFNVPGYKNEDMERVKYKSGMKEIFRSLDIPVARGRVFTDYEDALALVTELGYPVCIKPDNGVGASDTWRIENKDDLNRFFSAKTDVDYIMEEFIEGDIVTFDGLTDQDGEVVFTSTLLYDKAVLDIVSQDSDMYYYIDRVIPEDLMEYGLRCVKAFKLVERFFHFEFFRLKDGSLMALEVNCRPPGGNTMDMFNYANNVDMYAQYANVVLDNKMTTTIDRPYYCCYISRKGKRNYRHSHDEIMARYGANIMSTETIPGVFAAVMGDFGYVFRTPDFDELHAIIDFISGVH